MNSSVYRANRPSAMPYFYLAVAMIPAFMLLQILDASRMQDIDYWDLLGSVVTQEGGVDLWGFGQLINEQTNILSRALYLVNAYLFGGSNIALGVLGWLLVLAQALILLHQTPGELKEDSALWAAAVFLVFALLFSPQAIHNYVLSMSGAAWFPANLLCLISLAVVLNGRPFIAIGAAILGTLFYGTGLAIFPSAILTALIARRPARELIAYLLAMVIAFGIYLVAYFGSDRPGGASESVADLLHTMILVGGNVWAEHSVVAAVLGALGLALLGILAWPILLRRQIHGAFWVGLGAYAVACAFLIGLARGHGLSGLFSRYASISALIWIVIGVLALVRWGPRPVLIVAGISLISYGYYVSGADLRFYHELQDTKEVIAVAVRLERPPHFERPGFGWVPSNRDFLDKLKALRHYPFNSDFSTDCGLMGQTLNPKDIRPRPRSLHGKIERIEPDRPNLYAATGWILDDRSNIECLLATNTTGKVVGAAYLGLDRHDLRRRDYLPHSDIGWAGFFIGQGSGEPVALVVRYVGDGAIYRF